MRLGTCCSWIVSSAALLAAGCTSDSAPDTEYCDPAELTAALAGASAGSTVRVGACTVMGTFTVPAGVTLEGRDATQSVLEGADSHGAVVRLQPGAAGSQAVLSKIRVESRSLVGVHANGAGAVGLRDVQVRATEGVGLAFVDSTSVLLERVAAVGPVPSEGGNRPEVVWNRVSAVAPERVEPADPDRCTGTIPPDECAIDDRQEIACPGCGMVRQFCDSTCQWTSVVATQGLALVRVATATLTDVDVRGFAEIGVLATGDGTQVLQWARGTVTGNIGLGVYADGVQATLEGVRIESTFQGIRIQPAAAAYFGVLGGPPTNVVSTGLSIDGNQGFGAIHVNAEARHEGLVASNNRQAALWAGSTTRFELSGAMLTGNRLAGIVLVHASGVSITDSMIAGTLATTARVGSEGVFGSVTLGDGIQIFDSMSGVTLSRVTLENNERVGLSLDLGDGASGVGADICHAARDGVCFEAVTIRGTDEQHGALAGNMRDQLVNTEGMPVDGGYTVQPIAPGGWDEGITREVETDDGAFGDVLEMAGIDGPIDTPAPDIAGIDGPID